MEAVPMKLSTWLLGFTAAASLGASALAGPAGAGVHPNAQVLGPGIRHLVVIYQENHSFDNLYGGWDAIEGQTPNGRANATAGNITQVRQDNTTAYGCLYPLDVNLPSPPLSTTCSDHTGTLPIDSHFT